MPVTKSNEMNGIAVRSNLIEIQLGIRDGAKSMRDKEHSHYGNGIRALNILETKGGRLLEILPALEAWMRDREHQLGFFWIQWMLELGTRAVGSYKQWSRWISLSPISSEDDLVDWKQVEAVYTGSFDVRYSVALETSFQAAKRFAQRPFHHERPCKGGLVCWDCECDDSAWIQTCLEEVALPNNIFWNPALQGAFLAEIKESGALVALKPPVGWSLPSKNRDMHVSSSEIQGSTPFQCVAKLVRRVEWEWFGFVSVCQTTSDYELYGILHNCLPRLAERIQRDLRVCQTIREMY